MGEPHAVALRLAAPGLGALVLVLSLGGAGAASLVLLAAIVCWSARLILAVGDAAEGRSDRWPVLTCGAAVVCLVAAGATHLAFLAAGTVVCAALELLGSPAVAAGGVPEPGELAEAPVSRAA